MHIARILPALSLTVVLCGTSSLLTPQPALVQTTPSKPQLSTQPDLSLLTQTANSFLQSDRIQTESTTQLSGKQAGVSFTVEMQAKTIVQTPNKFRAEVTSTPIGGARPTKSLVVSDGKQVWIYRADAKQYTVMPYAKFDQLDDSYTVGMSSLLFLAIAPDLRPLIAQGALSNASLQKEISSAVDSSVKGGIRTLESQPFYVFEYTDAKEGSTYSAFVEPKTGVLKQIQLTGKTQSLDFSVTEKILRRVANPSVTANTFKFTPPSTAKRVKSLEVVPL